MSLPAQSADVWSEDSLDLERLYSPAAIANFFIDKGCQTKNLVDPMKLQKLVYFAHGWCLAIYGRPLIDERIEAWTYGPVVPSLYHAIKHNGSAPLESPIALRPSVFDDKPPRVDHDDNETVELLERIWEVYGKHSSLSLSQMSHDPEGAWHKIWEGEARRGRIKGVDIPETLIKEYFIQLAAAKSATL